MKNEVPTPAVYAAVAVVVVILAAVGYFALRDKAPTKAVNMVGRDQLKGPPPMTAPPAWAMDKFRAAAAGGGH